MTTSNSTSGDTKRHNAVVLQRLCTNLPKELGGSYSSTLGIDLVSVRSEEIFKWLMASLLLGDNTNEGTAKKTYGEFEKAKVISSDAILQTGYEGLVDILDQGNYGAYSFKLASRLMEVADAVEDRYRDDLNYLHFSARDKKDLEEMLRGLGKGIRMNTANIFLREMRDLWEKAEPPLSEVTMVASGNLGLIQAIDAEQALEQLWVMWEENGKTQGRFSDLEAALMRLGKSYCQKRRCLPCPVRPDCWKANRY